MRSFVSVSKRMSFYATTEAFLAECLGGRYQPIGDDFAGSSVEVLSGAEFVPGLMEVASVAGSIEPSSETAAETQ